MKNIVAILFLLGIIASCSEKKTVYQTIITPTGTWELVWDEEFEYTGLPDSAKWSYDTRGNATGWGNAEA